MLAVRKGCYRVCMSDNSNDHDETSGCTGEQQERDYLLGRASDHRRMAEMADEAELKMIHTRFQHLYEARAQRCDWVDLD